MKLFPKRETYAVEYNVANLSRGYQTVNFTGKFFSAKGAERAAFRKRGFRSSKLPYRWENARFVYNVSVVKID